MGRGSGGEDPQAPPASPSAGFTLIELLVVLTLLGILAGVSVAAFPSLTRQGRPTVGAKLAEARRSAIGTGRETALSIPDAKSGAVRVWRFMPDGRAMGPGIDRRTGAITDSALALEVTP